jgi:hypothetical protein
MPIKRPLNQQLQEQSFVALQSVINKMNCQFRRHEPDNAGIDGEIDLVTDGEFLGKLLKVQVKAGKSYITAETEDKLRIKVERRYVDLWLAMNIPVILVYFDSENSRLFWKDIKPYFKLEVNLLREDKQNIIIQFDKLVDQLNADALAKLILAADGALNYDKFIFTKEENEVLTTNWFPVISLPTYIYLSKSSNRDRKEITYKLKNYYPFILRDSCLFTFSKLSNSACELRLFCAETAIEQKSINEIDPKYYAELLRQVLIIACRNRSLIARGDRFVFPPSGQQANDSSYFAYPAMQRGDETRRAKVYMSYKNGIAEFKHHSIKLQLIKQANNWFLEIEPDWYFSYPNDPSKGSKEIGIRITREKQGMFNKDYLYLLHAFKHYLADCNDCIRFKVDSLADSQELVVSIDALSGRSEFRIYHDYFGPKEQILCK